MLNIFHTADTESLQSFSQKLLWKLCQETEAVQGAFYALHVNSEIRKMKFITGYAFHLPDTSSLEFEFGEGIVGQVAKEGKPIVISSVPEGYLTVYSGLGECSPSSLFVYPIVENNNVIGVMELASFQPISEKVENFLRSNSESISQVFSRLITVNHQ